MINISQQLKGFELYGRLLALDARLSAMRISNQENLPKGIIIYEESDFQDIQKEVEILVAAIKILRG